MITTMASNVTIRPICEFHAGNTTVRMSYVDHLYRFEFITKDGKRDTCIEMDGWEMVACLNAFIAANSGSAK